MKTEPLVKALWLSLSIHDIVRMGGDAMPRLSRIKSKTGMYHIILRGLNQQTIFEDNEDNEKFLEILGICKTLSGFELYGYCLMGNHIHLLLKTASEDLVPHQASF